LAGGGKLLPGYASRNAVVNERQGIAVTTMHVCIVEKGSSNFPTHMHMQGKQQVKMTGILSGVHGMDASL
jgi:hypothetical protein